MAALNFEVPKIRRPLDLGKYSPELEGRQIYVWVNPPRGLKNEYFASTYSLGIGIKNETADGAGRISRFAGAFKRKRSARKVVRWYARLWSETEAGDNFGGREIEAFAEDLIDEDPALWTFLCNATWKMINAWVESSKKASMALSS